MAAGHALAQSSGPATLNASGGTTTSGGNVFDWSIGEMTMVTSITASNIVVTQGVLQPADAVASSVKNTAQLADQLKVFPNPATSLINVQYASPTDGELTCKLSDMAGRLIITQTYTITAGTVTELVDVSGLAAATYLLEVSLKSATAERSSITYKIDKLN